MLSSSRSVENETLRFERRTRHKLCMNVDCACQSLITNYLAHVTVNNMHRRHNLSPFSPPLLKLEMCPLLDIKTSKLECTLHSDTLYGEYDLRATSFFLNLLLLILIYRGSLSLSKSDRALRR